jgi:type I restriction enzyme S subunit
VKAAELRQSILQAAVQGRLVSQDVNDEPASELLKHIQREKAQLIKEGKIKKEKPLPPIMEDEIPYAIPNGWVWCRIGFLIQLAENNNIHSNYSSDTLINYVDIDAIDNKNYRIRETKLLPVRKLSTRARRIIKKGDILYSLVRPYLNNIAIVEDDKENYIGTTGFAVFNPFHIPNNYFVYVLLCPYIKEYYFSHLSGFNSPSVSQEDFLNTLFPLPPLVEQQRIVEKVERLLALCKELEAAEEELDTLEKYFTENLSKSILQAVVRGKLASQSPHDEPASKLLKRIQKERVRLIEKGKIKKEKPLPPITENEIPYGLPDGWVWCRLGDVFLINMGQSPDGNSVSSEGIGIEFHQGKSFFTQMFLDKAPSFTTQPTKIANPGNVLLAVRAPVGVVNITMRQICIGRGLCALQGLAGIDSKFIFYFLKPMEEYFNQQATGTTFRAISAEIIKSVPFPLPPLAEQQRIVSKVDELMTLCYELKTARDISFNKPMPKVFSFSPQEDEDILIAARGDASKGLSAKAQSDIDKLFAENANE